jgi:hypothetical protein
MQMKISIGGGTISTAKQVSPHTDPQIHTQIGNSEGSGDGGDISGLSNIV